MTRVDLAQEQIQRLERAISDARQEYADWDEATLNAYLAPIVGELDTLRAAVDEALGLESIRAARTEQTWIEIRGGRVGSGRAPANAVGAVLEAVQKGVRQIAAFVQAGHAFSSRIPDHIADAAELDVVAFAPGSMKVAVVASIPQLDALQGATTAEGSLRTFIEAAHWAEEGASDEQLDELLPDPRLRRQVASRLREIAPSGRGPYETISFRGYAVPDRRDMEVVSLSRRAFDRSTEYLATRQREAVEYRGQLVAIDVERDVFDLRFETYRLHCHFGPDLLEKAKELIQEFVEVRGEGVFQIGAEHPSRINCESVRQLTMEEQAGLE